ncbi:MAG: uncharacterized protein A8A55_2745 [Amphiamblys sp. WSBS2006]|nr:MAG: uncharacterized protein A8A55_2745 [Amphiamblys sp. WSBS2006]
MENFLSEFLSAEKDEEKRAAAFDLAAETSAADLRKEAVILSAQLATVSLPVDALSAQLASQKFFLLAVVQLARRARSAWEWEQLSPYKKQIGCAPSDAGKNIDGLSKKLNAVYLKDASWLVDEQGEQTELMDVGGLGFWCLKRELWFLKKEKREQDEGGYQDAFVKHFLWAAFGSGIRIHQSIPMGENYTADVRIMTIGGKVAILEMKKNKWDLKHAIYQAALYSLLYAFTEGGQKHYSFILVAVSLPDFHARFGSIVFDLVGDDLNIQNPYFVYGDDFHWEDAANASKIISHFYCVPLEMPEQTAQTQPATNETNTTTQAERLNTQEEQHEPEKEESQASARRSPRKKTNARRAKESNGTRGKRNKR